MRNGHPWIFSGAVERPPRDADTGDIVDVFDAHERFVCRGFYNRRSLIRVRSLTQDPSRPIDAAFFTERIAQAIALRRSAGLSAHTNAMRLIHGESDGLPGLIADDYAGYLVVQFHTAGMEKQRPAILDALQSLLAPRSLYERSDVGTRRAEGLDRPTHRPASRRSTARIRRDRRARHAPLRRPLSRPEDRLFPSTSAPTASTSSNSPAASACSTSSPIRAAFLPTPSKAVHPAPSTSIYRPKSCPPPAAPRRQPPPRLPFRPVDRRCLSLCGRTGRPRPPLRYRRLRPPLADAETQPVQTGHGRLYQTQSQRLPPHSRRRSAGNRLVLSANFPRGLLPNRPPRRRWRPSPPPASSPTTCTQPTIQ